MNYITDERQAELFAADILRRWGFSDAKATPVGPDGGIDVVSRDALAQVKWRGGAASLAEVQRLYGSRGHGHEQLFFFAASRYTPGAVEYARREGINLFVYGPAGDTTAIHTAGQWGEPRRSWSSPDWVALLHGCRSVLSALECYHLPNTGSNERLDRWQSVWC